MRRILFIKLKFQLLFFIGTLLLGGCSGGSSASSQAQLPEQTKNNDTPETSSWPPSTSNSLPDKFGVIVDSPVEGLRYISGKHYGTTDVNGLLVT